MIANKNGKSVITVESFISTLEHPLKEAIVALRRLLLSANPEISEEVKWNAPSFRTSEHFATMHLRAKDSLQLILHLGAKSKRTIPSGAIADPHELLKWLSADRASIIFNGEADLACKSHALLEIIRQWIKHV